MCIYNDKYLMESFRNRSISIIAWKGYKVDCNGDLENLIRYGYLEIDDDSNFIKANRFTPYSDGESTGPGLYCFFSKEDLLNYSYFPNANSIAIKVKIDPIDILAAKNHKIDGLILVASKVEIIDKNIDWRSV